MSTMFQRHLTNAIQYARLTHLLICGATLELASVEACSKDHQHMHSINATFAYRVDVKSVLKAVRGAHALDRALLAHAELCLQAVVATYDLLDFEYRLGLCGTDTAAALNKRLAGTGITIRSFKISSFSMDAATMKYRDRELLRPPEMSRDEWTILDRT